ncbi:hypothetical protein BCV70DRAFT_93911 [Testicularia cyperi]|uniref:Zn(2)-C6 fungal-type domain-containing protein n=1 Tax=Testicularia cyperi TaxID=1882483 RepID=A0A317XEM7_9BASI|nr:hypothetical protein BCV70DRAFT_93911 [Testicularia cyperi]
MPAHNDPSTAIDALADIAAAQWHRYQQQQHLSRQSLSPPTASAAVASSSMRSQNVHHRRTASRDSRARGGASPSPSPSTSASHLQHLPLEHQSVAASATTRIAAMAVATTSTSTRSSTPSRHDRRASQACQICRARKTRCDAQTPSCSYCSRHNLQCVYVADDLRKQRTTKRPRSSTTSSSSSRPASASRSMSSRQRLDLAPSAQPGAQSSETLENPSLSSQSKPLASARQPPVAALSGSHRSCNHQSGPDQLTPAPVQGLRSDIDLSSLASPSSPNFPILPNELIEALSGKVAWFDELERGSQAKTSQSVPVASLSTAAPSPVSSHAASIDPSLADLANPSATGTHTVCGKERVIQLHYFRAFGGATAVTQGLKKISVRIRVPAELESMLVEAQNRANFFDSASAGIDPQTLDLHSLLGTSRFAPGLPDQIHSHRQAASSSNSFSLPMPHPHNLSTSSTLSNSTFEGDLPEKAMREILLDRFFHNLGDHFPFIDRHRLEAQLLRASSVNPALIHAICALASRFVQPHEASIVSPSILTEHDISPDAGCGSHRPHSRGIHFAEKAKSYVMSSITCPSATTVATLVLLAWHEFGVNSEGGLWMFAGMALRMSIDLGLHRRANKDWFTAVAGAPIATDVIEPQRLFWAVFILDRLLSVGTGRPTSLKDQEINLDYPSLTCAAPDNASRGEGQRSDNETRRPSVFGYLTRLMQKAGALAEIANNLGDEHSHQPLEDLDKLEAALIADYDRIPDELILGEEQFRQSSEPRCLLSLHLWFHNLLMILNRLPLSRLRAAAVGPEESQEILRHASQQIRNAVLYANAVDLNILLGCPFTNQSFCLAGSFEVSTAATLQRKESNKATGAGVTRHSTPRASLLASARKGRAQGRGARSLFVQSHLDAYQRCVDALDRLSGHWLGVTWIANALKARKMEEGGEIGMSGPASRGACKSKGAIAHGGGSSGETMLSYSELSWTLGQA